MTSVSSAGEREAIRPAGLSAEVADRFAYSYGVRHGTLLWISGQVALRDGKVVGEGDIELQARTVFENLARVVEAAGGSLDDIVETTTYMTDRAYSPVINAVRNEFLTGPVKPTSTLLVVNGLARPEFLVEISAVAVLSGRGAGADDAGREAAP
jgi:2-iminobutanoate/2-iminopropanoate deaminase